MGVEGVNIHNYDDSINSDIEPDSKAGSDHKTRKSKGYDRRLKFAKKAAEISSGMYIEGSSANIRRFQTSNATQEDDPTESTKKTLEFLNAPPTLKQKIEKVMLHWVVTAIMITATLYALFGDDFRVAFFTKKADPGFNVLTILALLLFTVEISINSVIQSGYWNSFYFWLDVVSTISLITDITWIWNAMIGQEEDYDATNAD